jgi:hypothetical protein
MSQDIFGGQWKQMRGELKSRMTAVALIVTLVTGAR